MTITIPQEAFVVICGPSCSGKTTLAKRIMQMAPSSSKYHYSLDKETIIAMRAIPELQICAEELARGGFYFEYAHSPEVNAQLTLKRSEQLTDALANHQIFIYDGILLSRQGTFRQLAAMNWARSAFGHRHDPLVLIKMLPEERLHYEFFSERQEKQDNACLPPEHVLVQRLEFAMEIANYEFTKALRIDRECREYTVTDPRAVELVVK